MSAKILMLGWEFPPFNTGGLGVACQGILEGLEHYSNLEITFVLPKNLALKTGKNYSFSYPDKNLKFCYFDSILSPYLNQTSYQKMLQTIIAEEKNPNYALTLEQEVYRYSRFAENIAKMGDFDLIHAHDWLTIPLGLELKSLLNKPLIIQYHATEVDRSNSRENFIFGIEKQGLEAADKIIAVSNHTKQVLIKEYNADPHKIQVVHNGISPCDLDFDQKAHDFAHSLQNLKDSGLQLVVFAGRLTYQKGVKYLLEAAKHVIKHNENVLFIIAGTGDLETHLLHESGRHGISHKVLFTGNLAKKELQSLYQAADLFVMPSISEPFGLVALEAGSQNTPLIISKTSGASEVLNHALKVDFWDSHLMANYILAVLEHSALGNTMNEHTTSEISQLTWQECGKKLNSIYMMVINSCRATA